MRTLFPAFLPIFVILIAIVARRPAILLRRRGAVSPETAQPLTDADLRRGDRGRLERLLRQGVVREGPGGTYYYDQTGERARVRRQMPIALAIVVVAVLLAVALAYWMGA